jgi:hypothetical protein
MTADPDDLAFALAIRRAPPEPGRDRDAHEARRPTQIEASLLTVLTAMAGILSGSRISPVSRGDLLLAGVTRLFEH